jgi:hypothetical protein
MAGSKSLRRTITLVPRPDSEHQVSATWNLFVSEFHSSAVGIRFILIEFVQASKIKLGVPVKNAAAKNESTQA